MSTISCGCGPQFPARCSSKGAWSHRAAAAGLCRPYPAACCMRTSQPRLPPRSRRPAAPPPAAASPPPRQRRRRLRDPRRSRPPGSRRYLRKHCRRHRWSSRRCSRAQRCRQRWRGPGCWGPACLFAPQRSTVSCRQPHRVPKPPRWGALTTRGGEHGGIGVGALHSWHGGRAVLSPESRGDGGPAVDHGVGDVVALSRVEQARPDEAHRLIKRNTPSPSGRQQESAPAWAW